MTKGILIIILILLTILVGGCSQTGSLLKDYYTLFRETYYKDETGISQLEKILGKPLDNIDEDYMEYIKSFKQ